MPNRCHLTPVEEHRVGEIFHSCCKSTAEHQSKIQSPEYRDVDLQRKGIQKPRRGNEDSKFWTK